MRSSLIAITAAAFLAAAGCDGGSSLPGDQAADAVKPDKVSAKDLQAAVADPRAKRFYAARNWEAAWNEDQARELTEALRQAPMHGLEAVKFLREGDAARSPADREAALTLAAISYASALANGQVDPRRIWKVYSVPMPKVDVEAGLAEAIGKGDVGSWLAGLAPQDHEYKQLSEAFIRYSNAARNPSQTVPTGKAIKPGSSDPRIPAINAALRANDYLGEPQSAEEASNLYRPQLAGAVKRLQQDYGQEPDGIIGKATIEALNKGPAERARTLALNLERRRWLQRDPAATRIDVNTAAAFLNYWRDGKMVDTRRVVVGQTGWETPPLGSPIVRLVANPPWNVPESIEQDELLAKGAAYLARKGFTRKDGRLVQASGPDSALGLVKFDMSNPHAIYLHDTPAKALFASNERHASHGCVRVHNAVQFARLLAKDEGQLAEFDKALASGKESSIQVGKPIPVRLLYHSAYVENGRLVFRSDPYGWDEDLARALGLPVKGGPRAIRTHISISGP